MIALAKLSALGLTEDEGLDAWKAQIQAVKDKYPK
jgi:hypothetical protein